MFYGIIKSKGSENLKNLVLYNPLAGKGRGEARSRLINLTDGNTEFINMTEIADYDVFFKQTEPDDRVIICGGDGTLNCFINATEGIAYSNEVYYWAAGSGNDFLHDLGHKESKELFPIKEYILGLPTLTVKGKAYRFINGVGFGIDGYCCRERDRLIKMGKKFASYALVALKGLIFAFKPCNATVVVDGKEFKYSRVWMVPCMFGRYFGGGMKVAPTQDRNNPDRSFTVLVAHNLSKLKIISLFLSIFKGNHIKYTKHITLHNAKEVTVTFDKPCDMQIDGEPLTDVSSYTVKAAQKEEMTV